VTYLLHLWRNGCSEEANHQNEGIFKMSITSRATRRSLLAGIPAAAAAIAVPATATALSELPTQPADDPIFAAIEEYKRADHEVLDLSEEYDLAHSRTLNNFKPWPTGDVDKEVWDAWWERTGFYNLESVARYYDARDAFDAAIDELIEIRPTTLAGAAALLTLWCETNPLEDGAMCWHGPVVRNLSDVLRRLTAEAQS
jgi:hypothetical protein